MKWLLLTLVVLSGCAGHTHSKVKFGGSNPHASVKVHIESASGLAALLGLSILAAGVLESEAHWYSESNPRYVPEMAADRKVSEQDCTKPIDYTLGNIRCK